MTSASPRTDPVRQRLLDVGRDLFCRRGFDGVSVREITSKARANLGAITYYFGSKEQLYHEVIDMIGHSFATGLAAAAAGRGPGIDRVERVVRMALTHHKTGPGVPAILLRELAGDAPLPPPIVSLLKRNVGVVAGIIEDGQKDGSIRAGDPMLLALSVISQPFYFNIAGRGIAQALGISRNDPDVWTHVVEHVVTSVRHTIAAEQAQQIRKPVPKRTLKRPQEALPER